MKNSTVNKIKSKGRYGNLCPCCIDFHKQKQKKIDSRKFRWKDKIELKCIENEEETQSNST